MRQTVLLVIVLGCSGAASAAPVNQPPKAGAGLDAEVHASWTRVPLRAWTASVSSLAGRPVILDRRIDPEQPVTLAAHGETLREILGRVAQEAGAAVDELESTIRITPSSVAGKASRAEQDRRLRLTKAPAEARHTLTSDEAWSWPPAARPRDLIEHLASKAGLAIEGIDTIPHDHFPAAEWPRLSLAERFDLVLAHFDRRVAWTTAASKPVGRIVPIDAEIAPAAVAHAKQPRARAPTKRVRTAKIRDEFTLRLEAPLDQALMAIARQLDLEVEIDRESLVARGIALGEIARADVTKVSRDELFDAILQPLGLAWQLDGTRLQVFAPRASEPASETP
jgi:hypothetical protein